MSDTEPTAELVGVAVARPVPLDVSLDVSIVAPTRNEEGNVYALAEAVTAAMMGHGRSWELLFVDDSDDATPDTIAELSSRSPHMRLLHRPREDRRGGLSGAVVDGFSAVRGRVVVVMDGHLQHPPEVARELATLVLSGTADIAVASRYVPGASCGGLDGTGRRLTSRACTGVAHALLPGTRGIRDPMSGFFAVSRSRLEGARLRPHGFKILMELLARGHGARVVELPFQTAPRAPGATKAGAREGVRFLGHVGRLARPRRSSAGAAARWLALQIPLATILAIQSWLSIQLIYRNTAFLDEATYLSAGHYLLQTWFHGGGADMRFSTYLSGSPDIYPVLAALVDNVGGLVAARFLSLGFMLVATVCCYATAKHLWSRPAGWLAATVFVTTAGAQFLGAFATFDAMALMLIAGAAWIVVRLANTAHRSAAIGLVIPVLILANATKYASTIFDIPVLGLAFFAVMERGGARIAARTTAILAAGLVGGDALLLGVAGPAALTGVVSTTLSRTPGNTSPGFVLEQAWIWVGGVLCLAFVGLILGGAMAGRGRLSWSVVGLLAVAAVAVLLAPANQARIDTATSLSKHVAFGAWFGALGAGWLLSQVAGRRPRHGWRYALAALVVLPLGLAGAAQGRQLFDGWPSSTSLIAALRPLVSQQAAPVLMDDAQVAGYYLENELSGPHWISTLSFHYTPPGSAIQLVGPAAYARAVAHGYFGVIALDHGPDIAVDQAVSAALRASGRYAWVGDFTSHDAYGADTFVVYRLVAPTS